MSSQHYMVVGEADQDVLPQTRLLYLTLAQYSADWNCALHTNACSELFFITGGSGRLQIRQSAFPVAVHDLVVVNPGVPHSGTNQDNGPMECIVLGVEGLEAFAGSSGFVRLHIQTGWDELMYCLQLMLQEARQRQPGFSRVCQHLFDIVLLRLTRRNDFTLSPEPPSCRGCRECDLVRRYIDSHFKENLTLDQLASIAHINKYYLVHAFQREFNTSPINYLISRRIQESRFLLGETDLPLSQIAKILGFSSLSYFSQSFRRLEGINPKEYRKRHRR